MILSNYFWFPDIPPRTAARDQDTSSKLGPRKKREKFHSISASPIIHREPKSREIKDLQSNQ